MKTMVLKPGTGKILRSTGINLGKVNARIGNGSAARTEWSVRVFIPTIKVVSEANQREHWAVKAKRKNNQKDEVYIGLIGAFPFTPVAPAKVFLASRGKCYITLTRYGKRMDSDNLAGSFKHVQDAVAVALNIDDGDERLQWSYCQHPGRGGVLIEIASSPDELPPGPSKSKSTKA